LFSTRLKKTDECVETFLKDFNKQVQRLTADDFDHFVSVESVLGHICTMGLSGVYFGGGLRLPFPVYICVQNMFKIAHFIRQILRKSIIKLAASCYAEFYQKSCPCRRQ